MHRQDYGYAAHAATPLARTFQKNGPPPCSVHIATSECGSTRNHIHPSCSKAGLFSTGASFDLVAVAAAAAAGRDDRFGATVPAAVSGRGMIHNQQY